MLSLAALSAAPMERACRAFARTVGPEPAASAPARLHLRCLGELQVHDATRCLTPPGRARDLLVCLLARGAREQRAASVAAVLWPHGETDYALGALNTTLYRLRRRPGLSRLLRLHDGQIGIDQHHCAVDRWLLEAALDAALALLELGEGSDAAQLDDLLGLVLTLYRGPLLEHEDGTLVVQARHRLRLRVASVATRADGWIEQHGATPRHWLTRVAAADPDIAAAGPLPGPRLR